MRISDWSADVCSSDLAQRQPHHPAGAPPDGAGAVDPVPALRPQPADLRAEHLLRQARGLPQGDPADLAFAGGGELYRAAGALRQRYQTSSSTRGLHACQPPTTISTTLAASIRSEEHTSELQSLMRTSYAVFCL